MAEEQRCQEGHHLCANNCGFFGSLATMNLCSKCYRDLQLKEEHASSAKAAVEKSLLPPTSSSPVPLSSLPESSASAAEISQEQRKPPLPLSRCMACRKRVGLTGFQCRCGMTFCGVHRYPEMHSCSFDYKAAGREAISRENPVVKAAKLHKI